MTETEISNLTGFDNGEEFESEKSVRAYFQRDELLSLTCVHPDDGFCGFCNCEATNPDPADFECKRCGSAVYTPAIPCQSWLDAAADAVIKNKWCCNF